MNQWKATETQEQIAVADYLRLKGIMFLHVPNEGKQIEIGRASCRERV